MLSERRTIKDKFGINRLVNFVQILKVEQLPTGANIVKKSRMFFKDFDGSLIEVPQRKIILKDHELRKLKMSNR